MNNGNGYGRPGLVHPGAEATAQRIEERKRKRRARLRDPLAAAREARGYKPGEGSKMAQRLREKGK